MANSAYYTVVQGFKSYLQAGIPASKLVAAFPSYGYKYQCVDSILSDVSSSKVPSCTLDSNLQQYTCQAQGCLYHFPNSTVQRPSTYSQIGWSVINKLLTQSTTGRLWDPTSLTPFFNVAQSGSSPISVWYDDKESLSLKVAAAREMFLRGVGVWTVDDMPPGYWEILNINN